MSFFESGFSTGESSDFDHHDYTETHHGSDFGDHHHESFSEPNSYKGGEEHYVEEVEHYHPHHAPFHHEAPPYHEEGHQFASGPANNRVNDPRELFN